MLDGIEITTGQWVYVGLMRGKVVRTQTYQGITYVDIEVEGVITPYTIDQITPE